MSFVWGISTFLGYVALVAGVLWIGGNAFCRLAIQAAEGKPLDVTATSDQRLRAGHIIGVLERTAIFLGIAASKWEVLAAVVAIKGVARYQDLKDQDKAEYFMVGSLASLVWAVVVSLLLLGYDRVFGANIASALVLHSTN